jgi:hypothetical protein
MFHLRLLLLLNVLQSDMLDYEVDRLAIYQLCHKLERGD